MKTAAKVAAAAAGACATLALGAGTASAAHLYSGEGYQGISFDHSETRVLRDLGAGNAMDAVVPRDWLGFYLGDGSIYDTHPTWVDATIQQVIDETVARGGYMQFSVNDPAIWGSRFDVIQQW
ncbi:hypothetical protein AB4Z09_04495 [Rhodococcus sp. TAF43]|uniref:hypothetical protein n=1 Tax=unclassified Rhodococcus (in: high G+C Gram-positive bacteria) TaxID=192944 RepID=UPI0015840CC7|nr:hypothetical protein [Rhodococcus sp. W8901]QKT13518.1 hypothetical protein HUN07_24735 [Rhodococcus sp. W8901]